MHVTTGNDHTIYIHSHRVWGGAISSRGSFASQSIYPSHLAKGERGGIHLIHLETPAQRCNTDLLCQAGYLEFAFHWHRFTWGRDDTKFCRAWGWMEDNVRMLSGADHVGQLEKRDRGPEGARHASNGPLLAAGWGGCMGICMTDVDRLYRLRRGGILWDEPAACCGEPVRWGGVRSL